MNAHPSTQYPTNHTLSRQIPLVTPIGLFLCILINISICIAPTIHLFYLDILTYLRIHFTCSLVMTFLLSLPFFPLKLPVKPSIILLTLLPLQALLWTQSLSFPLWGLFVGLGITLFNILSFILCLRLKRKHPNQSLHNRLYLTASIGIIIAGYLPVQMTLLWIFILGTSGIL